MPAVGRLWPSVDDDIDVGDDDVGDDDVGNDDGEEEGDEVEIMSRIFPGMTKPAANCKVLNPDIPV